MNTKVFDRIISLAAIILAALTAVSAQEKASFASGEGAFAVDLPKTGVSIKELFTGGTGLKSRGKSYSWSGPGKYGCTVAYRKFDTAKPLTLAQKTAILNSARKSYIGYPRTKGVSFISNPYAFQGNRGLELRISKPEGGSIVRLFMTATRLYEIRVFSGKEKDVAGALKLMNSFRLLNMDELIAAKVEEVAPPLPQEPAVSKTKSDAEDENLKGKVKSVVYFYDSDAKNQRLRLREQYFDGRGNLLREVDFYEGFPNKVTLWGYIDGRRVSKTVKIEFEDDRRPPFEHPYFRDLPEKEKDPGVPKDTRFTNSYEYKYDALGRMAERAFYRNSGKLELLSVFEYKDNRMAIVSYDDDSKTRPVDVIVGDMDSEGNMTSFAALDGAGRPHYYTTFKYEFDPFGNWVKKKSYKPDLVDGKQVPVLKNIEHRTITYY